MNREKYLRSLERELKRLGVSDIEDILDEYREHFDCGMDEGYSEEEISARLGDPGEMAMQFAERTNAKKAGRRMTAPVRILADAGVTLGSVVAAALGVVLAAFGICCLAAGAQLTLGRNWISLIPAIPRPGALLMGLTLLALALEMLMVCLWYGGQFLRILRAYGRIRRNEPKQTARHKACCPGLMRTLAIIFLLLFAATFITCALQAGRIEFWHAWGWFTAA